MRTGKVFVITAGLFCIFLLGCEHVQANPEPSANKKFPMELVHLASELDVFDAGMTREMVIPGGADQRPTWIVSGRVKNETHWWVDGVWIRVSIFNKQTGEEEDSAVLKLEHLGIPPNNGVVAFSQAIRIVPPDQAWTWNYSVVKGYTEPMYSKNMPF